MSQQNEQALGINFDGTRNWVDDSELPTNGKVYGDVYNRVFTAQEMEQFYEKGPPE